MHELQRIEMAKSNIELMRQDIDEIDREITLLLEKRLDLAKKIGAIKSKSGVQILDEKREEKVLEHILDNIHNSSLAPAMMRIYERIMDESKDVQK